MLQTIQLKQFRSYKAGLFEFKKGVNIVVGANASGKTNLLEAIHVIATAKPLRSNENDLILYDEAWSRLDAMLDDGERIIKINENNKPTLIVNDIERKRPGQKDTLPVVVFEPVHMLILSSEPDRRRNYIDGILVQTNSKYKALLASYKRALTQRNRLLKLENVSEEQLFVWDVQVSQKGGEIAQARAELIDELDAVCEAHYRSISGTKDSLRLSYETKLSLLNYSDSFMKYLQENREKDKLRGFTGAGPHRDDMGVYLRERDAKIHASRGETRSIILSLKIAELEIIHKERDQKPLFLLDDVFSELDGSRRKALAEKLKDYQTFITTTDADVVIDHFSDCNIIPIG